MDTKALRQKILDLAIHGKLVPQDPNDEPASVLLERIRAEKERLIKEGKIKKGKKSAKTSDKPHYPFELPKGWVWTTVGEISQSILYGVSESAKSHGVYKLLRITDIQNNFVNWKTVPFSDYDESKAESYLLKDGDILFARTGATVGKSYLVTNLQENAIYASYLIRVQTYNQVLPEFVKYFFESGYYWSQILCNSVGIGQPNVNGTILANLMLPIPPIKEQKRIVKELTKWLRIIDNIDRGKESLQDSIKHAKTKILDLAIHGKLVPQDPNDEPAIELLKRINPKAEIITDNGHYQKNKRFEIPNTWELCKLGTISKIARGGSPRPIKDYLTNDANGINWIKIGDTTKEGKYINSVKEKIRPEGVKKSRMVHKGDFLLTNSMSFGRPYILNVDGCIHDGWLVISPIGEAYTSDFLYYLLSSSFAYEQFTNVASGGVVTNLNSDKVADTIFPLPPLAEQKRIVSKIEFIFTQMDTIEAAL